MKRVKNAFIGLFHLTVMILGGIVRINSVRNPKTIMLINRIILIIYITLFLAKRINYGQ